ncbi:hypothetical protein BHM03_00011804, partial [Ensete ventricosum]
EEHSRREGDAETKRRKKMKKGGHVVKEVEGRDHINAGIEYQLGFGQRQQQRQVRHGRVVEQLSLAFSFNPSPSNPIHCPSPQANPFLLPSPVMLSLHSGSKKEEVGVISR